jgi:uncharacterized protein YjbI with pentapeptide repeats
MERALASSASGTPASPAADPNDLDELRHSANEAGKLVRTSYLTVLAVGTYLAIAIGSTTDLMLLKGTGIELPLVGVELPVRGFYLVAPLLFFLVHLNLLVQLRILSDKLWDLDRCIRAQGWTAEQRRLERRKLFSFMFSHYLIGGQDSWVTRKLLAAIVVVTVLFLPVVVLLWALIRFLPYHDILVTWVDRGAVIADLTAILVLWPTIMGRQGLMRKVAHRIRLLVSGGPLRRNSGRRALRRNIGMRFHESLARHRRGIWAAVIPPLVAGPVLLAAVFPETPADIADPVDRVDLYAGRDHVQWCPPDAPETPPDLLVSPVGWLTYQLFDADGSPFHRSLRLGGLGIYAGNPKTEDVSNAISDREPVAMPARGRIPRLELAGRNLQFTDFSNAKMVRLSLANAHLLCARLAGAKLQGADLHGAWLQGATLLSAHLQGADLIGARLQGADLSGAWLQGAKLANAKLQGANLSGAHLEGADLNGARLDGANLTEAHLQGAILSDARLMGADLSRAKLIRADLTRAQLQGANLSEAKLQGADLSGAQLKSAYLLRVQLQAAKMSETTHLGLAFIRNIGLGKLTRKAAHKLAKDLDSELVELGWNKSEDKNTPPKNAPTFVKKLYALKKWAAVQANPEAGEQAFPIYDTLHWADANPNARGALCDAKVRKDLVYVCAFGTEKKNYYYHFQVAVLNFLPSLACSYQDENEVDDDIREIGAKINVVNGIQRAIVIALANRALPDTQGVSAATGDTKSGLARGLNAFPAYRGWLAVAILRNKARNCRGYQYLSAETISRLKDSANRYVPKTASTTPQKNWSDDYRRLCPPAC